jgi:photosystem II stability/assembly factor-like uncharacterized protein
MDIFSVNSGVVFNTADGGETWKLQFASGTAMKLYSIGFTDNEHGWANGIRTVGNFTFNVRLVTADGGQSWLEESLVQTDEIDPY